MQVVAHNLTVANHTPFLWQVALDLEYICHTSILDFICKSHKSYLNVVKCRCLYNIANIE